MPDADAAGEKAAAPKSIMTMRPFDIDTDVDACDAGDVGGCAAAPDPEAVSGTGAGEGEGTGPELDENTGADASRAPGMRQILDRETSRWIIPKE